MNKLQSEEKSIEAYIHFEKDKPEHLGFLINVGFTTKAVN